MSIEAMKQALEALETLDAGNTYKTHNAASALRQAIAEAEKQDAVQPDSVCKEDDGCPTEKAAEPEWYHGIDEHGCNRFYHKDEVRPSEFNNPLYTHPQPQPETETEYEPDDLTIAYLSGFHDGKKKREWVGLTDEEIKEIVGPWGDTPIKGYTRKLFDQIEAKLKEKNFD